MFNVDDSFNLQGFSEAEATERAEKIFHTLDRSVHDKREIFNNVDY